MQNLCHAFPSDVLYKVWPADLILSVSSCLPVFLDPLFYWLCRNTHCLLLSRHSSMRSTHSLFVSFSLPLPLDLLYTLCFVWIAPLTVFNAEEEDLRGFLSVSLWERLWHQQEDHQWHWNQETSWTQDWEKLHAGLESMKWVHLPPWALAHFSQKLTYVKQIRPNPLWHWPIQLKDLEEFVKMIAYGINGVYSNSNAGEKTVFQYWKDFTASWWRQAFLISLKTTQFVTNVSTL